jgi:hypothetical protein
LYVLPPIKVVERVPPDAVIGVNGIHTLPHAPPRYASITFNVVLILIIPFAGLAGRSAVVPTGSVTDPVSLIVVFLSVAIYLLPLTFRTTEVCQLYLVFHYAITFSTLR